LSLGQIVEFLSAIELSGRQVQCSVDDLKFLDLPAILAWGETYVVLKRVGPTRFHVFDPDRGWCSLRADEVTHMFGGLAIEVARTQAFRKRREPTPLNILSLFRWTPKFGGGLVQVLILSIVLQAYILLSPLYMRIVVDQAVLGSDNDLLSAIAVGFLMLALFNTGASALRGVAAQRINSLLNWDMTRRVFHHMIRLPLEWFQRRKLADTFVRFQALDPIRALISSGFILAMIDGFLSIGILIVLSILSLQLALVAMVSLTLYVIIRLACVPLNLRLSAQALTASIAEQGKRIETLRAIQTIKVMGGEAEREADWADKLGESIRTAQSSALVQVGVSTVQSLFTGVTSVVVVYVGAREILGGTMTIGVLLAAVAYQAQLSQRISAMVETIIQWRMLDMWSSRIADVVLTPVEPAATKSVAGGESIVIGSVRVSRVAFRYSGMDPFILRGADLDVKPGEYVAIQGPSGSGKSTLLKLICGLYMPSAGEITLEGRPLSYWGLRAARRSFGVVMQDDLLLSGSIAENVAAFDRDINRDHVWRCLAVSGMENEVAAMPLGLDTQIGDIGSNLSGGQVQRLQFARAIYRSPPVLLLDEATSHLDPKSEAVIAAAVKNYKGTRIVIAHSKRTIEGADRVLTLADGTLFEQQGPRFSAISEGML
jgi:ATP-binding cassette subfamily B protein RaxB